jgi:hypothetical protein
MLDAGDAVAASVAMRPWRAWRGWARTPKGLVDVGGLVIGDAIEALVHARRGPLRRQHTRPLTADDAASGAMVSVSWFRR